MKHIVLDPGTQTGQLLDPEFLDGQDVTGKTVFEVDDDFTWLGKTVDWDSLTVIDDLAGEQTRKWDRVKELRAEHAEAGVTIAGVGAVQTDETSRGNITALVVMAQVAIASETTFSEPFTLADNSVVTFDADGMIGMGVAVGQYVSDVYARARELRADIDAAATVADLDAIDVESGWPTD